MLSEVAMMETYQQSVLKPANIDMGCYNVMAHPKGQMVTKDLDWHR